VVRVLAFLFLLEQPDLEVYAVMKERFFLVFALGKETVSVIEVKPEFVGDLIQVERLGMLVDVP
jgi:hypothetical protein